MVESDALTSEVLAHAQVAARKDELNGPVTETVGPEKLRRWGDRSMMTLLHATRGVYSKPKLVAYSDAYAAEYQRARAIRVAEHLAG